MTRRKLRSVVLGLLALAAGLACCAGGPPESYVLLDRDARASAAFVLADDARRDDVLPIPVRASARVHVQNLRGAVEPAPLPGELLWVHGPELRVETLRIGSDVDPDQVLVTAAEPAAQALAASVGATLARRDDGRWVMHGAGVLTATASGDVPPGVVEVSPVRAAPGSTDGQVPPAQGGSHLVGAGPSGVQGAAPTSAPAVATAASTAGSSGASLGWSAPWFSTGYRSRRSWGSSRDWSWERGDEWSDEGAATGSGQGRVRVLGAVPRRAASVGCSATPWLRRARPDCRAAGPSASAQPSPDDPARSAPARGLPGAAARGRGHAPATTLGRTAPRRLAARPPSVAVRRE
jgi:hypothetical protein